MFKTKSIFKFELLSTIFIIILGIIFHFTYEWSNNNVLVGIFTPVNESIWEHLKLLYFPMLITTVIGYFYDGKNYENYICAKTSGIINAIIFTVIVYYTYSGVIGKNIDIINICIFLISVIFGQYIVLKNINSKEPCNKITAIIVLLVLWLLFIIFTFNPPNIGLFQNPLTGTYGI